MTKSNALTKKNKQHTLFIALKWQVLTVFAKNYQILEFIASWTARSGNLSYLLT
jgi:hypothetical protein